MSAVKKQTSKDSANQSMYNFYLKEIHKIPMLTRAEEYALATKSLEGCEESRNKLILANLRFVVSVVSKYKANNMSQMDLINEGNLGLIRAAERFNPEKGFHFISYAVWWIKQSILLAIQQKSHAIRLPLNRKAELRRLKSAIESLNKHENDIDVDIVEIADMANVNPVDAAHLLKISRDQISLDAPMSSSEESMTMLETIQDTQAANVDVESTLNDLKFELKDQMDVLSEKEKTIVKMRFGLDGNTTKSLQQIGNLMNLSKERIRQIEKKALLKIRNHHNSSSLMAYLY